MTEEEQHLRKIIFLADRLDKTSVIFQETPVCPYCIEIINIMDSKVKTSFTEVTIADRAYQIAEPVCPTCGRIVESRCHLVH